MTRLIDLPDPVPVLDEHLLKDESGRTICYLDQAKLQRIADNNNRRIELSGDYSPLVIGHTKDGEAETDSPPIVGYAGDFFVSKGTRQGHKIVPDKAGKKNYLFSRWRVYEEHKETLRKYPRRSVELWTSRWEVDPISLLGATTPDRDLGLVRMSDKGPSVKVMTPNEEEEELMPYEDPNIPSEEDTQPLTLAQLQQTQEFQFLHMLMEQMESQQGPEQEGEMAPEDGQPGQDGMEQEEMGGQDEPAGDYGEEEPEEVDEREPVRRSASFATAGGNNTFVPSGARTRMNRGNNTQRSERIRLARAEAAVDSYGEEVRQLKIQLARAKRETDLLALEAEGIDLDINDELDAVAPTDGPMMDEPRYQAHLEKIVKRYRRTVAPRQTINLAQISRNSGKGGRISPEDRKAAVDRVIRKARSPEDYDKLLAEELGESK